MRYAGVDGTPPFLTLGLNAKHTTNGGARSIDMVPRVRQQSGSKEHKKAIAGRLREIRGPRTQVAWSDAIRAVQQTVSKYEAGDIPSSWLFLARLHDRDGIDLNALLSTENGR